jgi:hypothetical protein
MEELKGSKLEIKNNNKIAIIDKSSEKVKKGGQTSLSPPNLK